MPKGKEKYKFITKKYKKQNLPPEEESDDSNERSGGQHNLCTLVLCTIKK